MKQSLLLFFLYRASYITAGEICMEQYQKSCSHVISYWYKKNPYRCAQKWDNVFRSQQIATIKAKLRDQSGGHYQEIGTLNDQLKELERQAQEQRKYYIVDESEGVHIVNNEAQQEFEKFEQEYNVQKTEFCCSLQ